MLTTERVHAGRLLEPNTLHILGLQLGYHWLNSLPDGWSNDRELLALFQLLQYFQESDIRDKSILDKRVKVLVDRQPVRGPKPDDILPIFSGATTRAELLMRLLIEKAFDTTDLAIIAIIREWADWLVEVVKNPTVPPEYSAHLINMLSLAAISVDMEAKTEAEAICILRILATLAGEIDAPEAALYQFESLASIARSTGSREDIQAALRSASTVADQNDARFVLEVAGLGLALDGQLSDEGRSGIESIPTTSIGIKSFGQLVRMGRLMRDFGLWRDSRVPLKKACQILAENRLRAQTWSDWLAASAGFGNVISDYVVAIGFSCKQLDVSETPCENCRADLDFALRLQSSGFLSRSQNAAPDEQTGTSLRVSRTEVFASAAHAVLVTRLGEAAFMHRYRFSRVFDDPGEALVQYSRSPSVDTLSRLEELNWEAGVSDLFTDFVNRKSDAELRTWPASSMMQFIPTDSRTIRADQQPWCWSASASSLRSNRKTLELADKSRAVYLGLDDLPTAGLERRVWHEITGNEPMLLSREALFTTLERGASFLHISSHALPSLRSDEPVLHVIDGVVKLDELFDASTGTVSQIVVAGCASTVAHPGAPSAYVSLASVLSYRGDCPVIGSTRVVSDIGAAGFGIAVWLSLFANDESLLSAWWSCLTASIENRWEDYWQNLVWGSTSLGFDLQMELTYSSRLTSPTVAKEISAFRLLA